MDKQLARISKFLSYVLRHKPQTIGLQLDSGGWAQLDELIRCAGQHGQCLNIDLITTVIMANDKQRFSISADGGRIRANQGHSFPVELGLIPQQPPDRLYHGTATRFLDAILQQGLLPSGRQHVHLSLDETTAHKVGQRHGKPVILTVDAAAMVVQNLIFYRSENGVWLTHHVPAKYLSVQRTCA